MSHKRLFWAVFICLFSGSLCSKTPSELLTKHCLEHDWPNVKSFIEREELAKINKGARKACLREAFCDSSSPLFELFLSLNENKLPSISDSCILALIQNGADKRLEVLYAHGQKIPKLIEGQSPLFYAQNNERSSELTEYLLYRLGTQNIDKRSYSSGRTALGEAIVQGFFNAAQILMANGADFVRALYSSNAHSLKEKIIEKTSNDDKIAKLWLSRRYDLATLLADDCYSLREKNILLEFLLRATTGEEHEHINFTLLLFHHSRLERLSESQPLKKVPKIAQKQEKEICLDLCDTSKKTLHKLESCGHTVCFECTEANCVFQLSELNMPSCPSPECRCPLSKTDCKNFKLSEIGVLKAHNKVLEHNLQNLKNYDPCPYRDCPGSGSKIRSFRGTHHSQCEVCGLVFCIRCRESHLGKSCGKFEKRERQDLVKNSSYLIKACPKCDWLVEKNEGCDHMTCSQCQYQFYWSTLKKY